MTGPQSSLTPDRPGRRGSLSRRHLLRLAAAGGVALPLGVVGRHGLAGVAPLSGPPRPVKLSWNPGAVCLSPVPVAAKTGLFAKYNLDVELISYAGATDQLLEAIATGKADAGVGMALRWLKPLEQGFDVKLTAGTHGGCLRLLVPKAAGITGLAQLRGKTVAVSDMASPSKNFFSVLLARQGLDPTTDVEWRQFPADLLGAAVAKGEAHALADGDPNVYQFLKDGTLAELSNNLQGDYHDRVCCVIGIRGSLLRDDPAVATALTRALLEAQDVTAAAPGDAAAAFKPYAPNSSVADLEAMLRSHTHHNHPIGSEFKRQLALYGEDLKLVKVLKPGTDPVKFADRIYADVLS